MFSVRGFTLVSKDVEKVKQNIQKEEIFQKVGYSNWTSYVWILSS